MKSFLQNFVTDLKQYSDGLNIKGILTDKPWALVDSDFEIQKLIFKKSKELIMSKDGNVIIGSWEYLPIAKSLLIDRGTDKILCNAAFVEEGVLILKMDGTKDDFFVLANENIIPDLDVYRYLNELKYKNLKIVKKKLFDGRILEVIEPSSFEDTLVGNKVTINNEKVSNGIYKSDLNDQKYIIENSIIKKVLYDKKYLTKDGVELIVEQSYLYSYAIDDTVKRNGIQVRDGKYRIVGAKNIVVRDGRIVETSFF